MTVLLSALIASTMAMAQTTIIQSNTGIGCSTVCINGNCTSTCGESNGESMKGNGEVVDELHDLNGFTEVLSADVDTLVTQSENFSVTVTADSNLQKQITVEVKENALHVSLKSGQYENATFKVQVTMPGLHRLTQRGAADLKFSGFDQSRLDLVAQGAGSIQGVDNVFTDFTLKADGAMKLDMTGSDLTNADINVNGSGDIRLNFAGNNGRISGQIQGVSELQYCGDATNEVEIFGIADVQRINCS